MTFLFQLDINLASWSSIGGWKENAAVYKTDNACKNLKMVLGTFWGAVKKAYNFSTENCPLPTVTYVNY